MNPNCTDIALSYGTPKWNVGDPMPVAQHFERTVELGMDLFIGPIAESEAIMTACTPRGLNTPDVKRWFGSRYGIGRRNPPGDNPWAWDGDRRLAHTLALARLIRPTSISMHYSARVRTDSDSPIEIIPPQDPYRRECFTFHDAREDWLRDEDINRLREVLPVFLAFGYPERIQRGMWLHEYAAQSAFTDVRFTLLATALEALVHSDRHRSTKQFVERLGQLADMHFDGSPDRSLLGTIYDLRSRIAHGQGMGTVTVAERDAYYAMETLLRNLILKAMSEREFADKFASPEAVRLALPI